LRFLILLTPALKRINNTRGRLELAQSLFQINFEFNLLKKFKTKEEKEKTKQKKGDARPATQISNTSDGSNK
jgi:hypothetical protein